MDRWLALLAIVLLAGCVQQPEPVACTADAMLCPDGSAVGRIPPECEFAACPPMKASAPLGAPEAISILKASYPEFEGYPNDNLPPQSILTEKAEQGWRVAFVQEGSGVPVIGAKCFLVNDNKSTQHTGDFKPASAEDADFYINNCSSYGLAELPPEPSALNAFTQKPLRWWCIASNKTLPSSVKCSLSSTALLSFGRRNTMRIPWLAGLKILCHAGRGFICLHGKMGVWRP
jgi:hypothetical protein